MSALAQARDGLARLPPLALYRFTVDQYHRMVDVGILGDEDPLELIEGLIVIKGNSTLAPAITVAQDDASDGMSSSRLPVRRFTVKEYNRLFQTGILGDADRVELLEGWIVNKKSHTPPHDVGVALLLKALNIRLPANWHCRGQSSVTADFSHPEPDVAVVRGSEWDHLTDHPRPRDAGLVAEVADTTLQSDRELKGALYARIGVPIYWIVNLVEAQLEIFTDPTGPDPDRCYRQHRDYHSDEEVPLVLDGREVARIPVRELLP